MVYEKQSIFHKRLTRFIIYDLFESRRVHTVVNLLLPFETFLFCHYASREASFSLRGCVLRYFGIRGVERNKLITARAGRFSNFYANDSPPEVYAWFPTSVNAFIRRFSMTNYSDKIATRSEISRRNFFPQFLSSSITLFSKIYFLCSPSSLMSLLHTINIK